MKDKKATQLSINDLVNEHKKEKSPSSKQLDLSNESLEGEYIKQEDLNAIFQYNANIKNLDELYSSITPFSKILVRVYLLEPSRSEGGLLTPYRQKLPVPTNVGVGSMMELESPYPYDGKAVVVAVPQHNTFLKPGDVIQLEIAPVRLSGVGQNATIQIPNGYLHPDANTTIVPTNPDNRHYGYLLVPSHEISVKL